MTGDLLVVVPTRRAWALERFLDSFAATATIADLTIVADADDVDTLRVLDGPLPPRTRAEVLPRSPTSAKVNHAAVPAARTHRSVMFLADDCVFGTAADPHASTGWDQAVTDVLARVPMVSVRDLSGREQILATHIAVRSEIITALGYLYYPAVKHFAADDVWTSLGSEARCLAYLPHVVIAHLHHLFGKAPVDAVYRDAFTAWYDRDLAELARWERDEKTRDLARVRAALTAIGYQPG